MPRKLVAVALLSLAVVPGAFARPAPIMPGVTFDALVGRTAAGPLRSYVITAPKPGGLYSLTPLLSNGTITGRETVSSMERHVAAQMTTIGVNGDFFNWLGGWPSGLLMQGGVLEHQPAENRSSVGIDTSGNLHVDRVSFSATWKGFSTLAYPISQLNEPPKPNSAALFTPAWGAATPPVNGLAVVLEPFPPATPFHDLVGDVTAIVPGSSVTIPRDGAVLLARGTAADAVRADALVGGRMTIRFTIRPDWSSVTDAVGGGPALVKSGKPIVNSGEALTNVQLYGHDPRTAIGQRADGGLVIVAADGRRRNWSAGISNRELAQTLIRHGCVIGFALDSGGSTTVAFDGKLLNRPSDPSGERPVGEALVIGYAGVYAPIPAATLSPNGDRYGDQESLTYKIVRPSTVSAKLIAPDGTARELDTGAKTPGLYRVAWNGTDANGAPVPEGRYRWSVTATDDLGRVTTASRAFTIDNTLGFVRVARNAKTVRFRLTRDANVRVTIVDRYIGTLKTFAKGRRAASTVTARWNGRDGRGRRVPSGAYTVHVIATSEIGTSDVAVPVRLRR